MSDDHSKSAPSPSVRRSRKWNIVWVVPILALLLGGWMLYRHFGTTGPVATIQFETAEGIQAGKTEVRCRSVKVGMVRNVKLSDDLNSVVVVCELNKEAGKLLRENTNFWVVKPRLTAAEISGLGTLLQGAYIELDPGPGGGDRRSHFDGLEVPPTTNSSVPGRRITLTTKEAGFLQIGAPIHYRGFEVGRIESRELSEDGSKVSYKAFISNEHSHLVTTNCRFWNSSGLDISAGTSGVTVRTPSIQSMISGGVSFGFNDGMDPGEPVEDGASFRLYGDKEAARRSTFTPTLKFLLLFDQSVRGLTTDSAVEFRGIPIGRISRISFDLLESHQDPRVPVLIEIDPSKCRPKSDDISMRPDILFFLEEVKEGLRASLKTTNLITGAVHIEFDYHADVEAASIGKLGQYATFPTVTGGLTELEPKINRILGKFQDLPLEKAIASLTEATESGLSMADSVRKMMEDPNFQQLPADLNETLDELRATLQSLKAVADLLERKPNAIIFGRDKKNDGDENDDQDAGPIRVGPRSR
ncbi:MAG: MlaD family protein [Akkermansiaceae bacterium]|nr:MlaD family protein [Akkermansiaceae bacterium]